MAERLASAFWFRAEGARIPWATLLKRRVAQLERLGVVDAALAEAMAAVERRPGDVHLRWSCSPRLGVPFGPFTVWVRTPKDTLRAVELQMSPRSDGIELRWGFVAATVDVGCTVIDGAQPVAVFASRGGGELTQTVGAAATRAPAGTHVTLRVRCSGATRVVLLNGRAPTVRCEDLASVVNDGAWQRLELVGLPVDRPWLGTAYDANDQGMLASLTDPVAAAKERLHRGGPPLGWWPLTELGRLAPAWTPPDYPRLLNEVRNDVLPRIASLYRPGGVPPDQNLLVDSPAVDPPHQGGRTSSLTATVALPPLALLSLPASGDPFLALATGFGTAYPADKTSEGWSLGRADFLVTAEYADTPLRRGPAIVAAYVPLPAEHDAMASPTTLTAERAGLVAPEQRDEPWRETIRVSWDRPEAAAALGRPSGAVVARYAVAGGPTAECLLAQRDAGDFRPLVVMPDGPAGTPNFARTALVDAAAVIPLGSGGRHPGYAVAVQDVFGVWSQWEDVLYSGTEPMPPSPRILALALTTTYAGSTACPALLEAELAVDWADRTPTRVELTALFFPMARPTAPAPPGAAPIGATPAGGFRRNVVLPFAGDALVAPAGVTVEYLDSAGENLTAPGPLQGGHGRRYRLRMPVPTLDFAPTRRWGVQVWVRSRLAVLPGDTPWSPDATHPARASAASPVPVAPLPAPIPQGVPLGSTPDADGHSHVRVSWSLPAGADVRTVVVWEAVESALRQTAGLPQRAKEGTIPGVRLQALHDAYDTLPAARRRAAFRRLLELPGAECEVDVVLPKGSTDIHLFTVTTVTSTAVESPWPNGSTPHQHLQAVIAPRLRRPAAPRVRAVVNLDGTVTLSLSAASRIDVQEFRLYRTRSVVAMRSVDAMGPAFAVVPIAAAPSDDPLTGEPTWTAVWTGPFDASWDDWFVRAVAIPVDIVPQEGVRGAPSAACEAVTVTVLPDAVPDLAPLSSDTWGAAHDGVFIRTSTSAPSRALALGSHRLSGRAGTVALEAATLESIVDGPILSAGPPPPSATTAPVLVHGTRASGRTPLALWFRRPVASNPVEVVLRLADPLGRVTEQHITVPPWVAPALPKLDLLDVFRIVGRGVVLHLRSNAPIDVTPPYALQVTVTPSPALWRRPPSAFPRTPGGLPLSPKLRPISASLPLDAIPHSTVPFGTAAAIQVLRSSDRPPHEYQLLVHVAPPFDVTVAIVSPTGGRVQVSTRVS